VIKAQPLRVFLRFLLLNLSIIFQIGFVPHNNDREIGTCLMSEFLDPHGHLLEGVHISDVVYDQCPLGATIVDGVQAVKLFLSSCIPDGKLVHLGLLASRVLGSHGLFEAGCV